MNKETVDLSPFEKTITYDDVRAYKKDHKAYDYLSWLLNFSIIVLIIWALAVLAITDIGQAAPILIFIGILIVSSATNRWWHLRILKRQVAFKQFAIRNNFSYYDKTKPEEQGGVFHRGRDQNARGVVQGSYKGHPFWFGNFYYTIRSGKYSRTIRVGVLNVTLPRAVPYVLLDGRQNTMDVARSVDTSQRLELEGDFNTHFTVYCPKDYERDVLYFLTPELMQALVDMQDIFDAEIVGKELYFYTSKELLPNSDMVKKLFALISTIGGEVVENTKRYQDWRADKSISTVAPAGLALKMSVWPAIFGTVLIVMYILMMIY